MTIKKLSQYHNLKKEIKQINDAINLLESTIIGASSLSNVKNAQTKKDSTTERIGLKIANLKEKLEKKTNLLIDEYEILEDYLEKVENAELRIIIRKRFLEEKTWYEIGKEINTDRSTPYYKLTKYLSKEFEEDDERKQNND